MQLDLQNKSHISLSIPSKQQPRLLHVGQCLPRACNTQDVTIIMNTDPASMALQQKPSQKQEDEAVIQMKTNELNIFETRIVPGEYILWNDSKFYAFG
jgi:hypothetical protein